MKSNLDAYAAKGTLDSEIVDLHFKGKAPSEIDDELKLLNGQARKTVVDYWAFDRATHGNKRANNQKLLDTD